MVGSGSLYPQAKSLCFMAHESSEKTEVQQPDAQTGERPARVPLAAWLVLGLIVLCVSGLRVHLLEVPLERDEGEYAYVGQRILQCETPYQRSYTMKFPGTHYAYALILAIFGQTDVGIHWGLLVVNAASIVLLFLLAARIFDPQVGLAAAGVFGLLSLSKVMLGFTANAEHFVVLPLLGGTLLLYRGVSERRYGLLLGAGVFLGLSVLMKQHATAFVVFGAVLLLVWGSLDWRQSFLRVFLFALGVAIPIGSMFLYLWAQGAFGPFWFWTVTYAQQYATSETFGEGMISLVRQAANITVSSPSLWALAVLGAIAVVRDKRERYRALFLLLFAGFSFLAVCPGLLFRAHYFLLLVPAASLLAGAGAAFLGRLCFPSLSVRPATATVAAAAIVIAILQQWNYLFTDGPQEITRSVYTLNPFPEAKELAHYLQANSEPGDCIAVLGSEPQIYFYSRRRAATGFLYTYPLTESHPYAEQMQKDMIEEIERENPRFLVDVHVYVSWSWMPLQPSSLLLYRWMSHYVQEHFWCAGVADILSEVHTEYRWGPQAAEYKPHSPFYLRLFERAKPH